VNQQTGREANPSKVERPSEGGYAAIKPTRKWAIIIVWHNPDPNNNETTGQNPGWSLFEGCSS
jgi:hypothetical protein